MTTRTPLPLPLTNRSMKFLCFALQCRLLSLSTSDDAAAENSAFIDLDARESATITACKFVGGVSASGYQDQPSNSSFTSLTTAKRASRPSRAASNSPIWCLDRELQKVCEVQLTTLQWDQCGAKLTIIWSNLFHQSYVVHIDGTIVNPSQELHLKSQQ